MVKPKIQRPDGNTKPIERLYNPNSLSRNSTNGAGVDKVLDSGESKDARNLVGPLVIDNDDSAAVDLGPIPIIPSRTESGLEFLPPKKERAFQASVLSCYLYNFAFATLSLVQIPVRYLAAAEFIINKFLMQVFVFIGHIHRIIPPLKFLDLLFLPFIKLERSIFHLVYSLARFLNPSLSKTPGYHVTILAGYVKEGFRVGGGLVMPLPLLAALMLSNPGLEPYVWTLIVPAIIFVIFNTIHRSISPIKTSLGIVTGEDALRRGESWTMPTVTQRDEAILNDRFERAAAVAFASRGFQCRLSGPQRTDKTEVVATEEGRGEISFFAYDGETPLLVICKRSGVIFGGDIKSYYAAKKEIEIYPGDRVVEQVVGESRGIKGRPRVAIVITLKTSLLSFDYLIHKFADVYILGDDNRLTILGD